MMSDKMINSIDNEDVSQAYHSLKTSENSVRPPEFVDDFIHRSAADAIRHTKKNRQNKYLIPVSVAASFVIVVGLVLNLFVVNTGEFGINNSSNVKQPMYMLQRSKPASAEIMITNIKRFIEDNNEEQARYEYKKFRYFYPNYQMDAALAEKLK